MGRSIVAWIIFRIGRLGLPLLVSTLLIASWFAITNNTRNEKWVSVTGEDEGILQRYQEALKNGKGFLKDGDKAIFYIQEEKLDGTQRKDIGKKLKQVIEKNNTLEAQRTLKTSVSSSEDTPPSSLLPLTTKSTTTARSTTSSMPSSASSEVTPRLTIPKHLMQYLPTKHRHNTCRINHYDRIAPYCSYCQEFNMTKVTIYLDNYHELNDENKEKIQGYKKDGEKCSLPEGSRCIFNMDDKNSDAVLKVVQALNASAPPRFCFPQTIILFSLSDLPQENDLGLSMYAEVHININIRSKVAYVELCKNMPHLLEMQSRPPPSPYERSGIAMFISNCNKKYNDRLIYLIKLMKHVRIDSYGRCLYNMRDKTGVFRPPSRKPDNWQEEFIRISSKYRMVIAFEHILEPHLVSEKIFLILRAGAIPIYRGAPDVDLQIPGNNSIINVADYPTIESLGKYLNRVLTDNSVFVKHTTWNKNVLNALNEKHCRVNTKSKAHGPDVLSCQMCHEAYKLKLSSYKRGSRACNCFDKPPPLY